MINLCGRNFGLAIACCGMLAVTGCSKIGNPIDAIAGNTAAPDEFQVIARKPLRMPSSVRLQDLPEPRLGEPSPLDPDPNADAARALLGAGSAGGTSVTSSSEAALVGAVRASADNRIVTDDDIAAKEDDSDELPSIFALTGLDGEPVKDALDPDAEARRLQTEGISPAPVNPNPESEEDGKSNSAIFRW
ncbi:MAG: DUF3035 domain-containing protein [Pseudomonadota bacterium]